MPVFTHRTRIDAAPGACFDASRSIEAHTGSMAGSRERAVAGRTRGLLGAGERVTWRAWHGGVPFVMISAITEFEAPRRFVDEQVRGPFAFWWHEHLFTPLGAGGTLMRDVVRFASPLRPVGTAVDRLVLTAYLEGLIRQRNTWLRAALEGGGGPAGVRTPPTGA